MRATASFVYLKCGFRMCHGVLVPPRLLCPFRFRFPAPRSLVLDLLLNPYMVISFSFCHAEVIISKIHIFVCTPADLFFGKRNRNRGKGTPGLAPSPCAPCAISALNLIYIHFIVRCSRVRTTLRSLLSLRERILISLQRRALMNSNVCVIELLKFQGTDQRTLHTYTHVSEEFQFWNTSEAFMFRI